MATRCLTEGFNFMRNNALQNRQFNTDQNHDDREALVGSNKVYDVELGTATNALPPEWIGSVDEIQFEFSRIKQKMKDLLSLHDRHLNRASLDDNIEEDRAIEVQTKELTQLFARSHRLVMQMNNRRYSVSTGQEVKLSSNIQSSLARNLQDLSTAFRKAQSTYLTKLKSRDERFKGYFEDPELNEQRDEADGLAEYHHRGFSGLQSQIVEENTAAVVQREHEINQIIKSIQELNDIFRDIAQLVVDQGTLVDRIDYNIEQTHDLVESGLEQLKKAEKSQKKNRKMLVIIILAIIVVILAILLITTKFK